MPIDQHGDEILHSIYGRKLGIDKGGHVAGVAGVRQPYEALTTATTNLCTPYGVTALSGTTAAYLLGGAAAVGIVKTIINASSITTAQMNVVRSGSEVFIGSTGLGGCNIALVGAGASIMLIAQSTAIWAPMGTATYASSAQSYVTITTST